MELFEIAPATLFMWRTERAIATPVSVIFHRQPWLNFGYARQRYGNFGLHWQQSASNSAETFSH
jgi:hypothetical protein